MHITKRRRFELFSEVRNKFETLFCDVLNVGIARNSKTHPRHADDDVYAICASAPQGRKGRILIQI